MTQDRNLFGREAELTEAVNDALTEAIISAYPSPGREFLYNRPRNKWGVVVSNDITALDQPGRIIVDRIVRFARAGGRGLDLLALVWSDKPGNDELGQLAEDWPPDREGALAKYSAPAARPPAPPAALEKLVSARSQLLDLGSFISGMRRPSKVPTCRRRKRPVGPPASRKSDFFTRATGQAPSCWPMCCDGYRHRRCAMSCAGRWQVRGLRAIISSSKSGSIRRCSGGRLQHVCSRGKDEVARVHDLQQCCSGSGGSHAIDVQARSPCQRRMKVPR